MTKAMEEARAIAEQAIDQCEGCGCDECQGNVQRIIATALAARDAEIDQARTDEREACIKAAAAYCWERYKGREPMNLTSPAVFTSHEWQKIEEHIRRALTAGGQHG